MEEIAVSWVKDAPILALLVYAWLTERRERIEKCDRLLNIILSLIGRNPNIDQ